MKKAVKELGIVKGKSAWYGPGYVVCGAQGSSPPPWGDCKLQMLKLESIRVDVNHESDSIPYKWSLLNLMPMVEKLASRLDVLGVIDINQWYILGHESVIC